MSFDHINACIIILSFTNEINIHILVIHTLISNRVYNYRKYV